MRLKLSALFIAMIGLSCSKEPTEYTEFYPVLLTRESLDASVKFHSPEKITAPAKIYYKDNYIFISEQFKGVHIINNTDPRNPVNTGYISIPGCIDMSIKDNTLYADNAVDLVAIDLSTIRSSSVNVTKRVRNVFPEAAPPDGKELPDQYKKENRPDNTILVAWKH